MNIISEHDIHEWKQYLTSEDYNYLVEFIENIKNNILNDKIIILFGECKTGKTTLTNTIKTYLGSNKCSIYALEEKNTNEDVNKLIIFRGNFETNKEMKKIKNIIKKNKYCIVETNCIENINTDILNDSKIIKMEHVFTP